MKRPIWRSPLSACCKVCMVSRTHSQLLCMHSTPCVSPPTRMGAAKSMNRRGAPSAGGASSAAMRGEEARTSPTCTRCSPGSNQGRSLTSWPTSNWSVALRTVPSASATPIQRLDGVSERARLSSAPTPGESSPCTHSSGEAASTSTVWARLNSPSDNCRAALEAMACSEALTSRSMRQRSSSPKASDISTVTPTSSEPKTRASCVRRPRRCQRPGSVLGGGAGESGGESSFNAEIRRQLF